MATAEADRYFALVTESDRLVQSIITRFNSESSSQQLKYSGLGLAITARFIDEFLTTNPSTDSLTLIITSTSPSKGHRTFYNLEKHLSPLPGTIRNRISVVHFCVDLTNLHTVSKLAKALVKAYSRIDYVFLNAEAAEFGGVDWAKFFKTLFKFKDWGAHRTYPNFGTQSVGCLSPQLTISGSLGEIGTVFCANVFGHYYLVHEIMGLLVTGIGRVIWTSSLESDSSSFTIGDLEGVNTSRPYESSMRLIDILSLTAGSPAMEPYTSEWLAYPPSIDEEAKLDTSIIIKKPQFYLSHPGICATSVLAYGVTGNICLFYWMILRFWFARFFGSFWHTVNTYSGAKSAVWVALASDGELEAKDACQVKWGSAIDKKSGRTVIKATKVEGFREGDWDSVCRDCWGTMEELRTGWWTKLHTPVV